MRTKIALLLAGVLWLPCARVAGQTDTVMHAPDLNGGGWLEGIQVTEVPGAPFSAKAVLEVTRQLPDGTTITRKSGMRIARDSQGRVYRERRAIVPSDSDKEAPLAAMLLFDTPAGTRTDCILMQRTCTVTKHVPVAAVTQEPAGMAKDGKSFLKRESVGIETVEGIEVQHTRETRTWREGAFGNDRPVMAVTEYWYAPSLQMNLAMTRYDPRGAVQKQKIVELSLSEPEAAQFRPPERFRVVDERQGKPGGSGQ